MAQAFGFEGLKGFEDGRRAGDAEAGFDDGQRGVVEAGEEDAGHAAHGAPLGLQGLEEEDGVPVAGPDVEGVIVKILFAKSESGELVGGGLHAAEGGGSLGQFPARALALASR